MHVAFQGQILLSELLTHKDAPLLGVDITVKSLLSTFANAKSDASFCVSQSSQSRGETEHTRPCRAAFRATSATPVVRKVCTDTQTK